MNNNNNAKNGGKVVSGPGEVEVGVTVSGEMKMWAVAPAPLGEVVVMMEVKDS